MSVWEIIALVVAVLVGLVAILALVGAWRLRRMRAANQARIDAVGPTELSGHANFFGQASAGTSQIRGLGTLLLTGTELVFLQLVPSRDLRISRESITSTGVTRHFLGKTQGRDLLVVTWDVNGMGDAAAFDTPNIDAWRSKIS